MGETRTALVTGASAGIGLEIARGLAKAGYRTVLAVRNREKGESAARDIGKTTGTEVPEVRVVDFSLMSSVRRFAADFVAAHPLLDVLVNNAGMWAASRAETTEGVESVWATNQLGYFLGTERLLPALRAARSARIVSVASELARDLDLEDVEFRRRAYRGVTAYAQSKQANRMWTRALARRLEGTKITANSMHPGGVATDLFGKGGSLLGKAVGVAVSMVGRTAAQGADTAVWLASSPEVEGRTGGFYYDRRLRRCRFDDPAAEERLYALCAAMTSAR